MNLSIVLRSLAAAVALLVLSASPAHAAEWSDNALRYWFSTAFAEPGIGTIDPGSKAVTSDTNITKNVVSFTHASGYKYGGNFLNADMLFSSPKDNVNGVVAEGATEVYVVYRHHLALNSFFDSKPFAFGPVRDVNIQFGADANTKNTTFAPGKVMPLAGFEVSFAVPGFLNVGVVAEKEWDTNGYAGKPVTFNVTPMFTAAWHINVVGGLSFEGFGTFNLPKGKDGFGNDTVSELLVHPKVMFDLGTLAGKKGYQVGVGYQYWLNKFGNDHTKLPGCAESALIAEVSVHI